MKVLHLCSYYYGSKLYENLMMELDKLMLRQEVYIPVMNGVKVQANNFGKCNFIIKETYSSLDRAIFYKKFKQNYSELIASTNISDVDVVHAHTLFTNGVMAYKLNKEFGVPYIVAVRNSDVNTFFKYFIHLRKLGVEILKNAQKIIFISPAYLENTIEKYIPEQHKVMIRNKSMVIPNGVNEYWVENKNMPKKISQKVKLIYAGEITKNKNIHKVIKDVVDMRQNGFEVQYNIVGDGPYKNKVIALINKLKADKYIIVHDKINDKEKLRDRYRENDVFVMTSTFETFGLSYIEALSQGVPVLYTKGQGIDGFFEDGKVGYSVAIGGSIQEEVKKIINNYDNMSKNTINIVDDFKWETIAKRYMNIYRELIDNKTTL